MESLWKFGGLTPLRLVKRVWSQTSDDDIFGRAAQLSYYFLLALFPLLLFMVSLLGFLAAPGTALRESLLSNMAHVLPVSASQLVGKTISEVHRSAGGGKLVFGIIAALWAASNGMIAICNTLNIAYQVRETRPWWKSRLAAVLLTVGLAVSVIIALTLLLYGEKIAEFVADHVGLGTVFTMTWKIVQWPLIMGFMLTAFGLIYYYAPNLKKPTWHWITPGAVFGFSLWFLGSLMFRIYLHYFNNYSATYGSLGAVIILMLWFYITGLSILMGGEVNSQIGHAAEESAERNQLLKQLQVSGVPRHSGRNKDKMDRRRAA